MKNVKRVSLLLLSLYVSSSAAAQAAIGTPTWIDPATKLMWTNKDNGADVDQPQAKAYCSSLQYAGYRDWRLPSLEELQGVYDPSVSTVKIVSGITYDAHVKDGLNLSTGWVWSSREGEHAGKPYQGAWFFQFFDLPTAVDKGKPRENFLHFSFQMRALCVRRPAV